MVMVQQAVLSIYGMGNERAYFLEEWKVREGIYVPPPPEGESESEKGVFLWMGKFVAGETVAIVAGDTDWSVLLRAPVFVGIPKEEDYLTAPDPPLAAIDAATHATLGLREAVDMLKHLKGLPDEANTRINQTKKAHSIYK